MVLQPDISQAVGRIATAVEGRVRVSRQLEHLRLLLKPEWTLLVRKRALLLAELLLQLRQIARNIALWG